MQSKGQVAVSMLVGESYVQAASGGGHLQGVQHVTALAAELTHFQFLKAFQFFIFLAQF